MMAVTDSPRTNTLSVGTLELRLPALPVVTVVLVGGVAAVVVEITDVLAGDTEVVITLEVRRGTRVGLTVLLVQAIRTVGQCVTSLDGVYTSLPTLELVGQATTFSDTFILSASAVRDAVTSEGDGNALSEATHEHRGAG